MGRSIFFLFLAPVLLLTPGLPAPGQDKKDKKGVKDATASVQDYALLKRYPEVVGKVGDLNLGNRALTLKVEYATLEPKKGGANPVMRNASLNMRLQSLALRQQQAMLISNPVQRQNRLRQIMLEMQRVNLEAYRNQVQGTPFKVGKAAKEFEMELQDKLVVRRASLPFEYDDKGFVKEYSKEKIAALRGKESNLPGFKAREEDLTPGQIVKVYLATPKGSQKTRKEEGVGNVERPQVRMVLILADSENAGLESQGPEKKKKQ